MKYFSVAEFIVWNWGSISSSTKNSPRKYILYTFLGIEVAGCQSYATFFQGRFHHLFNYLFYSIQYYLSIFVKLSKVVVFPEVTIKTLEIFKVDVVTEPVQNKIRKTESE